MKTGTALAEARIGGKHNVPVDGQVHRLAHFHVVERRLVGLEWHEVRGGLQQMTSPAT
jgi:hypothetical protein